MFLFFSYIWYNGRIIFVSRKIIVVDGRNYLLNWNLLSFFCVLGIGLGFESREVMDKDDVFMKLIFKKVKKKYK